MPVYQRIQDRFSFGEISPLNYSKTQTEGYYSSLQTAENVVVLQQAILTRRFGTEFIYDIGGASTAAEVRLFMFQIGIFSNYLLVVNPNTIDIVYQDVIVASLANPYPTAMIPSLNFMQDGGIPVIFSDGTIQPNEILRFAGAPINITGLSATPNSLASDDLGVGPGTILPVNFLTSGALPVTVPAINATVTYFIRVIDSFSFQIYGTPGNASAQISPFEIINSGSSSQLELLNNWVITPYNFTTFPTYDFARNYTDLNFQHTLYQGQLLFICQGGRVPLTGIITAAEGSFAITGAGTLFTTELSAGSVIGFNNEEHIVQIVVSDTLLRITNAAESDGDFTAYTTATVNFFTPEYVGGLILTPAQTLRIIAYNSPVQVQVAYLDGQLLTANTTDMPVSYNGSALFIGVPAFSDLRGWPTSGTFVQSRAVLCNTPSIPDLVCASVLGDSHNFNDAGVFETDAITQTVNDDKGAYILFPYGTKTLTIFTTSGIFSTPYNANVAFSPTNTKIEKEEESFIENVEAVWIDNQLFYVDGGGRRVRTLQFDIAISAYEFNTVSSFSEHLIQHPVCSAVYRNSLLLDISLVFFINADGSIACFNSLKEQNLQGWTHLTTQGQFVYAYGARGLCYFAVQRTINGVQRIYLEKLDFNILNDSASIFTFATPQSTVTGLEHLEGMPVKIIADQFVFGGTVLDGQLTLPFAATNVEIGLSYNPTVTTLPFAAPNSDSPVSFYRDKSYSNVYVDLYNSFGVYVNGTLIPMEGFGTPISPLLPPPMPQTGFYKTNPQQSALEGITITQIDPYPFTLRSLGFEVNVS